MSAAMCAAVSILPSPSAARAAEIRVSWLNVNLATSTKLGRRSQSQEPADVHARKLCQFMSAFHQLRTVELSQNHNARSKSLRARSVSDIRQCPIMLNRAGLS